MPKFIFSRYLTLSVLLPLLFTGCATAPIDRPLDNTVTLSSSLSYTLTSPPATFIAKTQSQLVEITYGQEQKRFIAQIEYGKNEIAMAAISIEGMPLFDFVWQLNSPMKINQYISLPNINIKNIIADIQFCHWPLLQVTSSLHGENINVSQKDIVDDVALIWQRTIKQEKQIILKIDKSASGFQLTHVLRGYHINLTDLNQEGI
jgi:hypothetical protein